MSIIHVNQIKSKISALFDGKIDISDLKAHKGEDLENFILSRSLAAYSIHFLTGASIESCAASITDGSEDNGIDAIYYDSGRKIIYLVQSKWIHNGIGEPDNGSIKKFIAGVKDLFNLSFDRFNQKVNDKASEITAALQDHETKYEIVVVYPGINKLAPPSTRDLDDLESETNDASEVLSTTVLNQSDLHKSLASSISGEPINLKIGLVSWGKTETPFKAYYGQVNGREIADWWERFQTRLFEKNLRNALGDTEVNSEIKETIKSTPENFWFFNNGITLVCNKANKDMVGGADRDHGTFHCDNISIVNGAQTVATIGKFFQSQKKKDKSIDKVYVPLRIIAIENDNTIGIQITKTNNRQNKIESRDFVRQDPEQIRIQTELAIDKIQYQLMRSDTPSLGTASFDLVESTTALACASCDPKLVVQLKREIGKLWENLSKAPYKSLFNASVSGLYVWRCVQIQRKIDERIAEITALKSGRDYGVAVHGNRIIAAIAFKTLNTRQLSKSNLDIEKYYSQAKINSAVDNAFNELNIKIQSKYSNAILPTLFKNASKCSILME